MTIPWLGDNETLFESTPYDRLRGASIQQTLYAKILSSTAGLPQGLYTDEIVGSAIVAGESGYDGASNVCLSGLAPSDAPRARVVATLQASCAVTAANMVFSGALSPTSSLSARSTVTVVCTNGTPYEVGLSAGMGVGATIAARKMTGPNGQTIGYGLFRDPAHTLLWGDVAGLQSSGVGVGGPLTLSVYGFAPAQNMPMAGLYADTITVTLTY
jgi:spore coat protein U-like protein